MKLSPAGRITGVLYSFAYLFPFSSLLSRNKKNSSELSYTGVYVLEEIALFLKSPKANVCFTRK